MNAGSKAPGAPKNPRPDCVPMVLTQLDISLEGEEKVGSLWERRREGPVWCPRVPPPRSHHAPARPLPLCLGGSSPENASGAAPGDEEEPLRAGTQHLPPLLNPLSGLGPPTQAASSSPLPKQEVAEPRGKWAASGNRARGPGAPSPQDPQPPRPALPQASTHPIPQHTHQPAGLPAQLLGIEGESSSRGPATFSASRQT